MVKIAFSPLVIVATPRSQPLITSSAASRNEKGRPRATDESNCSPFSSVPM